MAVLRAARDKGPPAASKVEKWLQGRDRPEDGEEGSGATLYLHLADLKDLQGDYDQAIFNCREALKLDDRNVVAMNNIAWLLAKRGKASEALDLINRAITLAGERAELLDTRATVQLALARTDEALKDLNDASVGGAGALPMRDFRSGPGPLQANNRKEAVTLHAPRAGRRGGPQAGTRPSAGHAGVPLKLQELKQQ